LDSLKGRGHGSQEDLALAPLTPVLEVPIPSSTSVRKGSELKPSPEVLKRAEKPPTANGMKKNTPKDDPAPPTPVSIPAEKNGQRGSHGRSKVNNKKDGAESKTDQKPGDNKNWKKPKSKKKNHQPNIKKAASVKESERKGG
jgi:hypothetical protein